MDTIELLAEISIYKERLKNAVEVVRCKDCKNWNQAICHSTVVPDARLCDCMNVYTEPDQFCKYGEMREDD